MVCVYKVSLLILGHKTRLKVRLGLVQVLSVSACTLKQDAN